MGSHWWHVSAKSSLLSLGVSKGGLSDRTSSENLSSSTFRCVHQKGLFASRKTKKKKKKKKKKGEDGTNIFHFRIFLSNKERSCPYNNLYQF